MTGVARSAGQGPVKLNTAWHRDLVPKRRGASVGADPIHTPHALAGEPWAPSPAVGIACHKLCCADSLLQCRQAGWGKEREGRGGSEDCLDFRVHDLCSRARAPW